jgi:predicted phosphodiesterase
MRYAIIADIHANLDGLQAVARSIAAERIDRVVCLGDIVGYHAEPSACLSLTRELDPTWVGGNHDRAVTGQIDLSGFSRMAAKAIEWTRDRLSAAEVGILGGMPLREEIDGAILAVHGAWHPEVGCEWMSLDTDEKRRRTFDAVGAHPSGARICAVGHTHVLGIHSFDGKEIRKIVADDLILDMNQYYLINPGTIGEPRSSDHRATYMIYDSDASHLSVRRVAYDFLSTLRKTAAAGLRPLSPVNRLPRPIRAAIKRYTRRFAVTPA